MIYERVDYSSIYSQLRLLLLTKRLHVALSEFISACVAPNPDALEEFLVKDGVLQILDLLEVKLMKNAIICHPLYKLQRRLTNYML